MAKRDSWASRTTFILAAVGSAVGLGNAWRFPGLAAKYGGGAYLFVYLIAMLVLGVPLLMMEIAIGRKTLNGAPGAFRTINKKTEWVGWAATSNAFVIATYYAVVFAWVLMMLGFSYKFANMTGDTEAARNLFANKIETTWAVKDWGIPPILIVFLLIAWILMYLCIRNGASSVGKVVKYTVFLPVICLVIMAVKGLTMSGAMDGVTKLFVPEWSALSNPNLWIDAVSQVFYSLSIMMAIMIAYGSYLKKDANIAVDAIIIAFSDLAVSVLSGLVMFTTMYGVGMNTGDMSDSGIATAFLIYPTAIVNLTKTGWFNAVFGGIFYLCLVTLAIDSAFSIIEGVSTAISDKFQLPHKKTTKWVCLVAGLISVVYITRAGLAVLDIVDHWSNAFTMILIGVLECIVVGWVFKPQKVLDEVNRSTKKFKMPAWWFVTSIKVLSPAALLVFFIWNVYDLFVKKNGKYSYDSWAEFAFGWLIMGLCLISGLIVHLIMKSKRNKKLLNEDKTWDDCE